MNGDGDGAGGVTQTKTEPAPHEARIAELSRESGSYRAQRNTALRRAHAFETVLKAHNIDTSGITPERLDALPISDGRVDGQFEYAAPSIQAKREPPRDNDGGAAAGLTRETIEKMSHAEINKRWDEVKTFLANERR